MTNPGKLRVAILADPIDNQRGGVHVYTREMVRALLDLNLPFDLILVREKRDPELRQDIRQIVIPNNRIGLGFASLRLFLLVPLVLWWVGVDIVLEPAHFGPFNLPRRIRRVTVIHDLTPILFPQFHRWHSQILQRIFLPGILKRASLVLANSRFTAEDILRVYPFTRGRVHYLLLGRDPAIRQRTDTEYLRAMGIREPFWLAVGTIEPRKNLILLLEAYRRLRDGGGPVTQLVVVGQMGWKADTFRKALDIHPFRQDIRLTGYVSPEDLSALYTSALALVYPSVYEGFGLPVLEAMACGCPVLCSGVSSLPEVGGAVARYIDPDDPVGLAREMKQVLTLSEAERQSWKEASLTQASRFTWEGLAEGLVPLLEALNRPEEGQVPDRTIDTGPATWESGAGRQQKERQQRTSHDATS